LAFSGLIKTIWKDTVGKVDMSNVSAVGLGGRLAVAGVGMYLKMKNPSVEIVSVEPSERVVILGNSVLIICGTILLLQQSSD
jgi:cysteine synthase